MLDKNWLQPDKELVKHNTQYIVFQKLKYFWMAKACYTKSIQYHIRLMAIFIGGVNRTIYELSIFRTDKVVALSETETSEYPASLFTCVSALWTTRYISLTIVANFLINEMLIYIKWPGILEFNRNWIAYVNKTIIVNKDSPIDSLTYINQKTITSSEFNHKCCPPLQCHMSRADEPRAQSIDFQEYSTWLRKTGDRC